MLVFMRSEVIDIELSDAPEINFNLGDILLSYLH